MMTGLFCMMIIIKIHNIKEEYVIKELCKTEFKYVDNYVDNFIKRDLVKKYYYLYILQINYFKYATLKSNI